MKAATWPRDEPLEERLLVIDPRSGVLHDSRVHDLPSYLAAGDVVVINDAATLPASFHTETRDLEMRLLARLGDDASYRALFFGGGRVVAVGTTVTRALESSAAEHGRLEPGEGEARLILGPGFRPRVTSGLLTGMHSRGTSHFALLEAFAPRALLERALEHAEHEGYLEHEFGDSCLVLPAQH